MRFKVDHDLHIHSLISPCCRHDSRQTKEAILAYGMTNDFRLLCVTDHLWDRNIYSPCGTWLNDGLDFEKGRELLPLPQSFRCRFLYGVEVDMDYMGNIGVSQEEMDTFDFLIFAPGHLHMDFTIDKKRIGNTAKEHKEYYKERLGRLLQMELPFHKCGLAHFTTPLVCMNEPVRVFELFTDYEYEQIFGRVADLGMGVELNLWKELSYTDSDRERILRPYRIAKAMGCQFYMGGDSHSPEGFTGKKEAFEQITDLLGLKEEQKFSFVVKNTPEGYDRYKV